ncbi:MAG: Rib/alpha-like domain-containing protein, partial [Microbacteriaceae bacterium]|nr:Rib/alpha-like domain-containing protein [Microbacteriaceae bacterium]
KVTEVPKDQTPAPVVPVAPKGKTEVPQGGNKTTEPIKDQDGKPLPPNTKFEKGPGAPAWAEVKPNGTVVVTPGKDVIPGEYKIPVVVKVPGQPDKTVEVPVKVTPAPNGGGAPLPPTIVKPIPPIPVGPTDPGTPTTPKKPEDGKGTPTDPKKPEDGKGNNQGGTQTPGQGTNQGGTPGGTQTPGGKGDQTPGGVTPTAPKGNIEVPQGGSNTTPPITDQNGKPLPGGTSFEKGKGAPDWATVNPNGTITVTPGKNVPTGAVKIPVIVKVPGQPDKVVEVTVVVTPGDKGDQTPGKDSKPIVPVTPSDKGGNAGDKGAGTGSQTPGSGNTGSNTGAGDKGGKDLANTGSATPTWMLVIGGVFAAAGALLLGRRRKGEN